MKITLELDTLRPQAAILDLREAVGILTFKVNESDAIEWQNKNHFGNAANELTWITGSQLVQSYKAFYPEPFNG